MADALTHTAVLDHPDGLDDVAAERLVEEITRLLLPYLLG